MNQKLVRKILEIWECSFSIVANGLEALEIIRTQQFDLILMDLHMPELDGCDTTVAIRSLEDNPNSNIPIIALTAAALLDEKKRAFDAGMNDFLTKPFSPKSLQNAILKWMRYPIEEKKEEEEKEELLSPSLDLSYLYSLSRNDPNFIRDMIDIFLKEIPLAMQQLDTHLEKKDWKEIHDLTHRVKSNYMMLGMKKQQNIALEVETMIKIKEIDADRIQALVKQLQLASELVYPLLKEKRQAVKVG